MNRNGGCNHYFGEDSTLERRDWDFPEDIVISEEAMQKANEIKDRLDYMYLLTVGGHNFPNSAEGDLLRMTYSLIKEMKEGK